VNEAEIAEELSREDFASKKRKQEELDLTNLTIQYGIYTYTAYYAVPNKSRPRREVLHYLQYYNIKQEGRYCI